MKKILLAALLGVLLISEAGAVVLYDPGTTYQTTALTGFATDGDMMDGMTITAFLNSGAVETFSWYDIGTRMGGIYGTGWYLRIYGDSFVYDWILLANVLINRIIIDAGAGNSVFDVSHDDLVGTPGSARGTTFAVASGLSNDGVTATYRDSVALTGTEPVGDLWKVLDISFHAPYMGYLRFRADTDSIAVPGDLDPIAVPEPPVSVLIITGLGNGSFVARIKKGRDGPYRRLCRLI